MKRFMYRLIPALALLVLLIGSVGCTRERPHAPVTPWKPTITPTPSALQSPTAEAVESSQTPAAPTPEPSATLPSEEAAQPLTPTMTQAAQTPPAQTPTPPSATPAGESQWEYYTVQRGDTLYSIAVRFNTTVEELQRLNGLSNTTIFVGQKLRVPSSGEGGDTGVVEYVVQEGDTLYSIARRFGVDMAEIARANNITDPSTIYVGQRLVIPGAQQTPASRLYYVQPGDTLTGIAQRFGVSLQALMEANNITDPDAIYAGQVLRIP